MKYTVIVVVGGVQRTVFVFGTNPYNASNKAIERFEADGYRRGEVNVIGTFEGWVE